MNLHNEFKKMSNFKHINKTADTNLFIFYSYDYDEGLLYCYVTWFTIHNNNLYS